MNINKLQEKILELQKLGFDFDTELFGDDKNGLVNSLKDYTNEDGDVDMWLIIRELGASFVWFNGKSIGNNKRYSKNTSTIIYEQYFLSNPISYIFEELKRITNGRFEYEVISEFGTTESDIIFWKHLDEKKGHDYFDCEYKIGGKPVKVQYNFFEPDWTYLEPDFINNFIKNNFDYLKSLDVNILEPEEFITFFCINKESQRRLKKEHSVFINNDLSFATAHQNNNQVYEEVNQNKSTKGWWEFWK
jgi:hypothetical protein